MYGGHPNHIVDLTYEELKKFHQTFYHPSNAKIMTYGNMDPEQHMSIIDEYLTKFEYQKSVFEITKSTK